MEFNEKLKELRARRGLTQDELAEKLYVSRTAVSKWESGKGYPNIESLKAIARFFSVSVDELLSGDALLSIAEEDGRRRESRTRTLIFGLLDCCAALLLFLPLYARRTGSSIHAVSLLELTEVQTYIRAAYLSVVILTVVFGIVTLALQSCRNEQWLYWKDRASLILGAAAVLLFTLGLQPYAAAFAFTLLLIKALLLIKRR